MYEGIFPLWKERGMTSHDCVFRLRKLLHMKRIGHTGTLDPAVEGVLPICLGEATKVAEYVADSGKVYEAVISIGRSTETEDAEGAVVEEDGAPKRIERYELLAALRSLTGEIEQVPPLYSAVKVNGRKLYEYARAGQTVERPKRLVSIQSIELLDAGDAFEGTEVEFCIRVACGKGTYIRTLATQIGERLGYPAHMKALVRTASGSFKAEECTALAGVEELVQRGSFGAHVFPLERALSAWPHVELDADLLARIRHGQVLDRHEALERAPKVVFTASGRAVAVYRSHPEKAGKMKPEKMFTWKGDGVHAHHSCSVSKPD